MGPMWGVAYQVPHVLEQRRQKVIVVPPSPRPLRRAASTGPVDRQRALATAVTIVDSAENFTLGCNLLRPTVVVRREEIRVRTQTHVRDNVMPAPASTPCASRARTPCCLSPRDLSPPAPSPCQVERSPGPGSFVIWAPSQQATPGSAKASQLLPSTPLGAGPPSPVKGTSHGAQPQVTSPRIRVAPATPTSAMSPLDRSSRFVLPQAEVSVGRRCLFPDSVPAGPLLGTSQSDICRVRESIDENHFEKARPSAPSETQSTEASTPPNCEVRHDTNQIMDRAGTPMTPTSGKHEFVLEHSMPHSGGGENMDTNNINTASTVKVEKVENDEESSRKLLQQCLQQYHEERRRWQEEREVLTQELNAARVVAQKALRHREVRTTGRRRSSSNKVATPRASAYQCR